MLSQSPKNNPIPPGVRDVLALYADALADVRFPDLDHAQLEALADALCTAQLEVERIEQQLEAARALALEQAAVLSARAERALAYARVFAEGNVELSARLAELGRGSGTNPLEGTSPKRRGRPKKSEGDAGLFTAVEGELAPADAEHAA